MNEGVGAADPATERIQLAPSHFATWFTTRPPVDGPVSCGSSSGPAIIACVGNAYPAYLVKTNAGSGSLERRHHNMEFIRDRIIETGICKGLDLARNFKRGTPVISHDFLVLRSNVGKDGRDRGVDIASGYDDVDKPLKLTWQVFDQRQGFGQPLLLKIPVGRLFIRELKGEGGVRGLPSPLSSRVRIVALPRTKSRWPPALRQLTNLADNSFR